MLLPLLAAFLCASYPEPDFSFSAPAQPLPKLVAVLAAKTGEALSVSPEMAGQVAFIDVRKTTEAEAFARLAKACGGRWQNVHGQQTLVRDDRQQMAIEATALAKRTTELTTELKRLNDILRPPKGDKDKSPQAVLSRQQREPIVLDLLMTIGPSQLAKIDYMERVVFSTEPLDRQAPLSDPDGLLAAYVQRKNERMNAQLDLLRHAYAEQGRDFDTDPNGARVRDRFKLITDWKKADLVVSRPFEGDDVDLELLLYLYDSRGQTVSFEQTTLSTPSVDDQEDNSTNVKPVFATLHLGPAATDLGLYYAKTFQTYGDFMHTEVGPPTELRRRVEARLLKPEQVDPLAYSADYVEKLAEREGLNVVGSLPDAFISFLPYNLTTLTVEALRKQLRERGDLIQTEENGWLTLSPPSFHHHNTPRKQLTALAPQIAALQDPTIDQKAALAIEGLGDAWQDAISQITLLMAPSLSDSLQNDDWDFLKFYGNLSADQRKKLSNTGRLAFADLGPDQMELLDRYIYGNGCSSSQRPPNLSVHVESNSPEDGPSDSMPDDYRSEPTEIAPSGLPSGGYLTVRQDTQDGIEPCYQNRPEVVVSGILTGPMDQVVDQLASEVASLAAPRRARDGAPVGFDHVRIGKQHMATFQIYVARDVYRTTWISENLFGPNCTYALADLPGDLKSKFARSLADARKAMMDEMGDGDGGNNGVP